MHRQVELANKTAGIVPQGREQPHQTPCEKNQLERHLFWRRKVKKKKKPGQGQPLKLPGGGGAR